MFICESCFEKSFELSGFHIANHYGQCEYCGNKRDCYNIHHSALKRKNSTPVPDSNFSQEKDFDTQLEEISNLYEGGKEAITAIQYRITVNAAEREAMFTRLYDTLSKLRDIAAVGLKVKHNISEN